MIDTDGAALTETLTQRMYHVAGDELADMVLELFEGKKNDALIWFMATEVQALGYRTPYRMCEDGKGADVEAVIHNLEHGVFM